MPGTTGFVLVDKGDYFQGWIIPLVSSNKFEQVKQAEMFAKDFL